ncbi:MAG: hypothetical protein HFI93_11660 [Lachnospiraceae bacterium]|nr:hypothetical protein [Lachnospiraceae bacterium]
MGKWDTDEGVQLMRPWTVLGVVLTQVIIVFLFFTEDKSFVMKLIPLFEIDMLDNIIDEWSLNRAVFKKKKWWIRLGSSCAYLLLYYGYYIYIRGDFSIFGIVFHEVVMQGLILFYMFLVIRNHRKKTGFDELYEEGAQ